MIHGRAFVYSRPIMFYQCGSLEITHRKEHETRTASNQEVMKKQSPTSTRQLIARPHSRLNTYVRTNRYGDGAKEAEANGQATRRGASETVNTRSRRSQSQGSSHRAEASTDRYFWEMVTNTYNHFGTNGMMDQWSGNITGRWCTCEGEGDRGRKS